MYTLKRFGSLAGSFGYGISSAGKHRPTVIPARSACSIINIFEVFVENLIRVVEGSVSQRGIARRYEIAFWKGEMSCKL